MKKTLFSLVIFACASVAQVEAACLNVAWDYFGDNIEGADSIYNPDRWYMTGCTIKNLIFSTDVGVTGTYKRQDNATGANFKSGTGAEWLNTAALEFMNADLNTSFTAAELNTFAYVGAGNTTLLTLSFSGDYADYPDRMITIYTTIASNSANLADGASLKITGLTSVDYVLASNTADAGFDGNFTDASNATTLVKITGYLEESNTVSLSVEGANHAGFGMLAVGQVVPEPATASLSLLGLAALMMRRRRA